MPSLSVAVPNAPPLHPLPESGNRPLRAFQRKAWGVSGGSGLALVPLVRPRAGNVRHPPLWTSHTPNDGFPISTLHAAACVTKFLHTCSTKVFDGISSGLMIFQRLPRRTGHDLWLLTVGSRLRETQNCSRYLCLLYFWSYSFYSSFCLVVFSVFVPFLLLLFFYYFSLFRFVSFSFFIIFKLFLFCYLFVLLLSSSSFLLVFFLATWRAPCTWFLCLLLLLLTFW